jgi:alginate O-acetyltransferase complex protein AlgI
MFYFLPLFFALYYALPCRNAVILLASLLFCAWGEAR